MPEHQIRGGELWLFPDETVVVEILPAANQLGLVTTRSGGLVYASTFVLGADHGYRYDVPRWHQGQLDHSIFANVEEATIAVSAIFGVPE